MGINKNKLPNLWRNEYIELILQGKKYCSIYNSQKKVMKAKIFKFALATVFTLALASCSGNKSAETTTEETVAPVEIVEVVEETPTDSLSCEGKEGCEHKENCENKEGCEHKEGGECAKDKA
ncbi:MAG: hypothetical protein Q3998_00470 [Porphyromonas sp.]|nr:hypothetical protein [Porphyromonas sp.]